MDLASLGGVPEKQRGRLRNPNRMAFSRNHNGRAAACPTVQCVWVDSEFVAA